MNNNVIKSSTSLTCQKIKVKTFFPLLLQILKDTVENHILQQYSQLYISNLIPETMPNISIHMTISHKNLLDNRVTLTHS